MILKAIDRMMSTIGEASTNESDRTDAIQLAAAVLLIDVARSDHDFADEEFDQVLSLVQSHFELDFEGASELVDRADARAREIVSVHEFTQFLHRNLDESEKESIVGLLWRVAYSDGRLHPYENALILKISDLLYVNRARSLRLKHDAETRDSVNGV